MMLAYSCKKESNKITPNTIQEVEDTTAWAGSYAEFCVPDSCSGSTLYISDNVVTITGTYPYFTVTGFIEYYIHSTMSASAAGNVLSLAPIAQNASGYRFNGATFTFSGKVAQVSATVSTNTCSWHITGTIRKP